MGKSGKTCISSQLADLNEPSLLTSLDLDFSMWGISKSFPILTFFADHLDLAQGDLTVNNKCRE